MRSLVLSLGLLACLVPQGLQAETAHPETSASPTAKKAEKPAAQKDEQAPVNKLFGTDKGSTSNEPTTTEIYADEAFFDSAKSTGVFSGHVKVKDPRFNVQSDKLTVFISKGENQGLERALAEGNVGVVRDRPDPNGGPPTRAVGRSETANYIAATGDVELRGTPRVQQGENTHIATSPDTVMIINQNGQLTTHGPSRTDIRQQPKDETDDGKAATKDGKTDAKTDAKPGAKPESKPQGKVEKPKASPKPSPTPSPKP
jgi:lipopolysaccharide transport protein LptA